MAAGLTDHAWSIAKLLAAGLEFQIYTYDNEKIGFLRHGISGA
jgi:hypothetical protein